MKSRPDDTKENQQASCLAVSANETMFQSVSEGDNRRRSSQVIARRWRWWKNGRRLFRPSLAVLQLLKRNLRSANHPISSSTLGHEGTI